ncbi:hypothetical protein FACS1894105_08800 [Clostridia bacterium]|nr:hypothetical protein FACS1894105_08800 [Clostridia bacterium]
MKQILSAILVAAVCLPTLFSCANENASDSDTTAANGATTASVSDASESTQRSDIKDSVPASLNFNGADFHVLYPDWSAYPLYYWTEEPGGDIMNDALCKRQLNIEERLGVKFKFTHNSDKTLQDMRTAVASGIHTYDLALTHYGISVDTFVAEGYVMPLDELPYIDFEQPWWNSGAMDSIALAGKHFLGVSDFIIPDPNATFFNKDMVKNYELDDPYQLVRDGKWTYDKMHELGKAVAADLNNDGKPDIGDRYGLVTQLDWYFISVPESFGIRYASTEPSTGRIVLTDKVSELQSALEIVNNLINDKSVTFAYPYGAVKDDQYASPLPLSTGQTLFHFDPLSRAMTYREVEIDYGILPWPKGTEAQPDYYSFTHAGFMTVPSTTTDFNKTGAVLELLSAEAYRHVVPAYFNIMLGQKLARDDDSAEM